MGAFFLFCVTDTLPEQLVLWRASMFTLLGEADWLVVICLAEKGAMNSRYT